MYSADRRVIYKEKVLREQIMFSIIIPVLQPNPLLFRCVDSIRNQKDISPVQIIVVYKKANKSLLSKIKNKLKKHNLIYIHQKKEGIYNAMNLGINKATRTFVLFLGEDDALNCSKTLQQLKKEITKNKKYNIYYGDVLIDSKRRFISNNDMLWIRNRIHHQGIAYERKIFHKYGAYNESYRLFSDYDFLLRINKKKCSFKKTNVIFSKSASQGRSGMPSLQNLREVIGIRNKHFSFPYNYLGNALSIVSYVVRKVKHSRKESKY